GGYLRAEQVERNAAVKALDRVVRVDEAENPVRRPGFAAGDTDLFGPGGYVVAQELVAVADRFGEAVEQHVALEGLEAGHGGHREQVRFPVDGDTCAPGLR